MRGTAPKKQAVLPSIHLSVRYICDFVHFISGSHLSFQLIIIVLPRSRFWKGSDLGRSALCVFPKFTTGCYNTLMTWALKRQLFYVFVLVLFFAVFGFLIAYPRFNKAPSCIDNKQNGTETGVDCGGSCLRPCGSQVDDIAVLWARAFRVIPGQYNAVAYLENQNRNTAV